jgi:hypothetical protein
MEIIYKLFLGIMALIGTYYSLKLVTIKKETIVKTLTSSSQLFTDIELIFSASIFAALHAVIGVISQDPKNPFYMITGILSAVLYLVAAIRIARRYTRW